MQLSVYQVKEGHKRKQIGMCETTMQNILANARNNTPEGQVEAIVASETDFLLQRNIHKLKEVGKLRVKLAALIAPSGEELMSPFGLPPRSPSRANTTSPSTSPLSASSSVNGEDPFVVDLRQMPVESSVPSTSLHEFIDSGGQLEFCVAIDFTSSNGKFLWCASLNEAA
jgi:hypothetical protein